MEKNATKRYSDTSFKPTSLVLSRHGMARPVAVEQPHNCIVPSLQFATAMGSFTLMITQIGSRICAESFILNSS